MQSRELILRILRLNLIPAPRVISPGPATRFSLIHIDAEGRERVVSSLRAARALSKAVAGSLGDKAAEDFFVEILPITATAELVVNPGAVDTLEGGMSGAEGPRYAACGSASVGSSRIPAAELLAAERMVARAAYALGLDSARATVGFGPGGPWVTHVEPASEESPGAPRDGFSIEFLGARAEYLTVDLRTGIPSNRFPFIGLSPEGEMVRSAGGDPAAPGPLAAEPATSGSPAPEPADSPQAPASKWVSSPMPYPDTPLSTRLVFRGTPNSRFLRVLDRSVAVLGMLASPRDEARERHATEEGLLGAYRVLGDGCFEYLSVPGLLWNPAAIRLLCESAGAAAASFSRETGSHRWPCTSPDHAAASLPRETAADSLAGSQHASWLAGLQDLYEFQRAYYHADKAYFTESLALPVGRLSGGCSGEEPGSRSEGDFRPAWGMEAQGFSEAWATLSVLPEADSATTGVWVTAGARSVPLQPGRLVEPDILERDRFTRSSPAWAPSAVLRPNPVLGGRLALPGDILYRASISGDAARGISIHTGPIVGIMIPEDPDTHRFGIETDRFRHMIRIGSEMGLLVYVFFPENVDWDSGLVKAWTYRDRRGWSAEWLPLPDVVYDRHIPDILPSGQINDVALDFQERCPRVQFINALPLVRACRDKMAAHRILAGAPGLRAHLPETEVALDASRVADFAASRKASFLKLRGGTGSKGLSLIENLGSQYQISRRERGCPPEVALVTGRAGLESAIENILERTGEARREYIIQERIDLAPLPREVGSAFEVRVIYQKGGAERWRRTGMVCRVNPTAERFMVPKEELHLRTGELLAQAFPGKENEVKESVRRVARMIPPALEGAAGRGGEMSIDLGVDKRGKPWLIEVNSKPATLFRDIGAFELRELSLVRVLNYAVALFHGQDAQTANNSG